MAIRNYINYICDSYISSGQHSSKGFCHANESKDALDTNTEFYFIPSETLI